MGDKYKRPGWHQQEARPVGGFITGSGICMRCSEGEPDIRVHTEVKHSGWLPAPTYMSEEAAVLHGYPRHHEWTDTYTGWICRDCHAAMWRWLGAEGGNDG